MENNIVLVVAVAALLGAAALQIILALAGYRADRRGRTHDHSVTNLQRDLRSLGGSAAGLTQRLARMETRLMQLAERQQEPAPMLTAAPADQTYQVAVKLVRRGADLQELVSTCGLTRGEAELILRLYRPQPVVRGAAQVAPSKPRKPAAAPGTVRAGAPVAAKPVPRRAPARFQTLC